MRSLVWKVLNHDAQGSTLTKADKKSIESSKSLDLPSDVTSQSD